MREEQRDWGAHSAAGMEMCLGGQRALGGRWGLSLQKTNCKR